VRLSHFFIERPVFAAVVAIVITLVGAIAFPNLAVSQYPQIAPPTVNVSATYPGASAEVLADTVAAPIEEQINGVENMLYLSSQATGDGHLTITVTFALGTDPDQAQVLVENRVAAATPLLPAQVNAVGVVTRKATPDILMAVHNYSPDGSLDQRYIANYVGLHTRDALLRVTGVGDISSRASRDYAMRIWIDPDRAAARGLTVQDITGALAAHNVQVAAGAIGQPPGADSTAAYQLNVEALGRLTTTPAAFTSAGSRGVAAATRFSTSTWAWLGSVPSLKVTVMARWPSPVDWLDRYSMFSTPLICSSIGVATLSARVSAEAPG